MTKSAPPIPEAALNQHIAILGKTGSGKTYTAKGIVEHLLREKRQVCIVDPTGAWWGLRLGADGKSKGFDVVLIGGKHADIPLSDRSGAAVARLVTQQGANVVIDTTGLTVAEYTRWFIDFAGTLYTTIRDPLHLVIDEAHYFMPQGRIPDPEAGKMLHAGNRLMSGGRSLGIRGLLVTQRPAKLHKDSLTCADTLIAMRLIAPQDRKAVEEWIDGQGDPVKGKEVLTSLAQLKRGQGWAWYPEGEYLERVTFPKIGTYDSSATPTHGAKAGPAVREIKLDEVKAALADAVKEAEANDPKLLRKRVAELEKELKAKHGAAPAAKGGIDPEVVSRKIEAERAAAAHSAQVAMKRALAPIVRDLSKTSERIAAQLGRVGEDLKSFTVSVQSFATIIEAPMAPVPAAAPLLNQNSHNARDTKLATPVQRRPTAEGRKAAEQRVLDACAQLAAMGVNPADSSAVGLLAGIDPTGGYFSNTVGPLSSEGLIERGAGTIRITQTGLAAANPPADALTLPEYHTMLRTVLAKKGNATARMLDALIEHGREPWPSSELGSAVNIDHTGGYFSNTIGPLSTLGLIERRNGVVTPTDLLFPTALA